MFILDPRTVLFINFIYIFCISIFIVSAFILEKHNFKGLLNWFIATLLLSLNFLILSLRNTIPISIIIVVPHIMAIAAYIEIKRGLSLFYKVKNRIYTDIIILTILVLLLLLNDSDIRLRVATVCITSIFVFLDTILLLSSKKVKQKIKNRFLPFLFSMAIVVMGIRLILGLQWDPTGNPLESGNNLSIISILFFITNIVILFALLFILLNKINDEKDELIEKLKSVSLTDELTAMRNRRGFNNVINYEMKRFSRTKKGFTLVMCDVDHFKKVNDTYGHVCGDYALKKFSDLLKQNMRGVDTVARWGGEEFVILFPETSLEEASVSLQRIRNEIEQFVFEYEGNSFNKTMSFGACYCDIPNVEIEKVILEADGNLYSAKASGRNQVKTSMFSIR